MTGSEQARADAMADAETLSKLCWDLGSRYKVTRSLDWAANYGYRTLDAIAGRNNYGGAVVAYAGARYAARYAFRAVPALRGDR